MNWEVWGPPLAILVVGLIAGGALARSARGQRRHGRGAERWARKDMLMDRLRALRADQDKHDPEDFETRWNSLLDTAARALRDAEAADDPTDPPPHETVESSRVNWKTRSAWILVTVLFFGGLGTLLQTSTALRGEGETMTGNAQSSRDSAITEALATVEKDPNDIDALNTLAHAKLQEGDLGAAMKWMDHARKIQPDDPEVRTHLAIMQVTVGMIDRAKGELITATTADPGLSEAWLWRGLIELRQGERETAVTLLERALETADGREERRGVSAALVEARRPPPEVKLTGSIEMSEGVARPSSGVLFIMVRRSPGSGGPPLAAVRLDPREIPGTFTVTDRDVMMDSDWPLQVWIDARLDADGNPTTKTAADLTSEQLGPFESGTEGIILSLSGGATVPNEVASGGMTVEGALAIAPGTSLPADATIFVIARRTEVTQGPPLAALRLPASAAPGPFSIGEANFMMGGTWPEAVWLQARADADGNAMTRGDDDVSSAVVGPVRPGTQDVVLQLGGD